MRQDDIRVKGEYAYLDAVWATEHPLKATVLSAPQGGSVNVRISHPDVGDYDVTRRTRDLVGEWTDEPSSERFPHHRPAVAEARAQGVPLTWAKLFEQRYAQVLRQRALADRLGEHGIPRGHSDYAGRGGNSVRAAFDTALQLNYAELEWLLDRLDGKPLEEVQAS